MTHQHEQQIREAIRGYLRPILKKYYIERGEELRNVLTVRPYFINPTDEVRALYDNEIEMAIQIREQEAQGRLF